LVFRLALRQNLYVIKSSYFKELV